MDNQDPANYWDRVAWDKNCTLPLPLAELTPHLDPASRILDYGCGYGRLAEQIWQVGCRRLIGVDPSREMIRRGRQTFPHLDLRQAAGLPIGFPDERFELVLVAGVLTSIPEDEVQQAVIKEAHRVLSPGGILCLVDFLLQPDERNRLRYALPHAPHLPYGVFELEDGALLRHHSRDWIETLTRPFHTLHFSEAQVITMNGHRAQAFSYLGRRGSGR